MKSMIVSYAGPQGPSGSTKLESVAMRLLQPLGKCLAVLAFLPALLVPAAAQAAAKLDRAQVDVSDVVSLQSGARTFVNYCLNCHSASLMRYNSLESIGLTEQQIRDNLMFTGDKVGDSMDVAFPNADAKAMFGTVPPDLSVIARSRGADWLYTYLRGFYRDPNTATGWNNTVYPNVGMPHVMWKLQGQRVLNQAAGEGVTRASFETVVPGTQSAAEYDRTVNDLVNFLVWMGEPHQAKRKQVGVWVVLSLLVLIALTYALKNAYWRDIR